MKSPTLSNISVDGSEKNDGKPNANIYMIKKDINGKQRTQSQDGDHTMLSNSIKDTYNESRGSSCFSIRS